MRIGYARTSTSNQKYSLENQIEKLTNTGCEKIFSEEISSVSARRPAFNSAIEFARDGDTLVVTTLSRFARSISDQNHYGDNWKEVANIDHKKLKSKETDVMKDLDDETMQKLSFNDGIHRVHYATSFCDTCFSKVTFLNTSSNRPASIDNLVT